MIDVHWTNSHALPVIVSHMRHDHIHFVMLIIMNRFFKSHASNKTHGLLSAITATRDMINGLQRLLTMLGPAKPVQWS